MIAWMIEEEFGVHYHPGHVRKLPINWAWFKSNRHWLEVHQLPPYAPELNR